MSWLAWVGVGIVVVWLLYMVALYQHAKARLTGAKRYD